MAERGGLGSPRTVMRLQLEAMRRAGEAIEARSRREALLRRYPALRRYIKPTRASRGVCGGGG